MRTQWETVREELGAGALLGERWGHLEGGVRCWSRHGDHVTARLGVSNLLSRPGKEGVPRPP